MMQTNVLQSPNSVIRIQGDVVFVRNQGETTVEDLHVIFQAYSLVRQKHGHVLALYDGRGGTSMSSDARREIIASARMPERVANASATFGAPFAMRALMKMLDRALMTLRGRSLGIVLFATEEEARAYLDNERRKLLAARSVAIQP
jgi:predicted Ser/Thr protein kinase